MAWMDLDAPIDITFGPYETYNDEIFGYKAGFESYVNIRDDAETAKLKFFGDHMQEVENNLPIDAQYRNSVRPMHELFVAPSRRHAHLIIPEGGENAPALDVIVGRLRYLLGA